MLVVALILSRRGSQRAQLVWLGMLDYMLYNYAFYLSDNEMTSEFEKRLKAVDQATLTPLVRCILENESAEVIDWRYQPLEGGFGESYGIYRFQGKARSPDETLA